MCLPFIGCCGGEQERGRPAPKPESQQTQGPQPKTPEWVDAGGKNREDAVVPGCNGPAHPGGGNKNGEGGGRNKNGEGAAATSNSSDADVLSDGVLGGRKGAAEKTALTEAPGAQAPPDAAAGAPHHGSSVAASQPKKATDKTVTRPAEDGDDDPAAANNFNGDPSHGVEDDRKARGKSW